MVNKGLVTVVVPVYNTEKFLNRCIRSIVSQTYKNLEILLIDDGSPDECPQICDAWANDDKRIRVIHKNNEGLGMARNTGIINAKGEYICFFDSDDYVDCYLVEKAYAIANEMSADLVTFGMTYVDENGRVIGTGIPTSGMEGVSACTRLFSMDLIKNADFKFQSERIVISEDCYAKFCLEVHVKNPVVLPEPLYFYCRNRESLSRTYRPDRYEKSKEFREICIQLFRSQGRVDSKKKDIDEWFLDSAITSIKQIAETNMISSTEKWDTLKRIVDDDTIQDMLRDPNVNIEGIRRIIFFCAIRQKCYAAVYLLAWLQTRRKIAWR